MGREIKRVDIDFEWPMKQTWKGYYNPYASLECRACERTGLCEEFRQIKRRVLQIEHGGGFLTNRLTKEEAEALKEEGLLDVAIEEEILNEHPTPGEVEDFYSDDAYFATPYRNDTKIRFFLTKMRAKNQGIWESRECSACESKGHFWFSDEIEEKSEQWEREDPPEGEGWQVWETVGEGSPITPVFENGEELIEHLAKNGTALDDPWLYKRAVEFVKETQWEPSGMIAV